MKFSLRRALKIAGLAVSVALMPGAALAVT
jgi:hypothetical protein